MPGGMRARSTCIVSRCEWAVCRDSSRTHTDTPQGIFVQNRSEPQVSTEAPGHRHRSIDMHSQSGDPERAGASSVETF